MRERGRERAAAAVWASVAFVAVTGPLLAIRAHLETLHVALAYLLLVLLASSRAGGRIGGAIAVISFLALNFLFLPPYYTLALDDPRNWIALVAYLTTALVAARLLSREQRATRRAAERAAEIDRIARLGAESIGAPRAVDALRAVESAIRETLGATICRVLPAESTGEDATPEGESAALAALRRAVLDHGVTGLLDEHGITRLRPLASPQSDVESALTFRCLVMPLRIRERLVGVVEVEHDRAMHLAPGALQLLHALSYYAALALDRARLARAVEREAAEREASHLREMVVAAVSHDLRTPLTAIRALAWQSAVDGDPRGVTITEEVDRLNRLVADLLDLSRLRANALPVRLEVNAVEDAFGVLLDRAASAMPERAVHVTLDTQEPLLLARYDEAHLLRVLTNLLENAHRHAPAGTAIDLVARRDGRDVVITVADCGPGVSEELRTRIFEPFVRGDGAGATNSGLGLAVAAGLARAMQGTLAHAPRPGGGSVFTLRLVASDLPEMMSSALER
jgi:two-component system sensor histidine kinase KdpD